MEIKKVLIVYFLIILNIQYSNSQDRKFYFEKKNVGNEVFLYLEDDSIYLFSFLSYAFCELGYSISCKCLKENNTIKSECIGDILIKKNNLLLIEKNENGLLKKTKFYEVLFPDELIKCLKQYGVIYENRNLLYMPNHMNNN